MIELLVALGRDVAIKILRSHLSENPESASRIECRRWTIGDRQVEYSPPEMADVDLFANLDGQHVLRPLKRARVCFPCLSQHAFGVGSM